MSYKLCRECDQPMLKKGQRRKHPNDYRHARDCPMASASERRATEKLWRELTRPILSASIARDSVAGAELSDDRACADRSGYCPRTLANRFWAYGDSHGVGAHRKGD